MPPVKFEFQINELFPRNCKGCSGTRKYLLFIWNSNLTGPLGFYLANLFTSPTSFWLLIPLVTRLWSPLGQLEWVPQRHSTNSELQPCGLTLPNRKEFWIKPAAPLYSLAFQRWVLRLPVNASCLLGSRSHLKKKKKNQITQRAHCQSIRAAQMHPLSSPLKWGLQIGAIEKEIGLTCFKTAPKWRN